MFGLKHCIHYECLMHGSNGLGDSAGRPPYFCAICYHKLSKCLHFEHVSKAKAMMDVCEELKGFFIVPNESEKDGKSYRDYFAERFKTYSEKIKPEDYGVDAKGKRVNYADKTRVIAEYKQFLQDG